MSTFGLNPFFTNRYPSKLHLFPQGFDPLRLLGEVEDRFKHAQMGYRSGVLLVPISSIGYRTGVVVLQEGDRLEGVFEARIPGETPRKKVGVVRTLDQLPPAALVEVVVYAKQVLEERDEPRSGADWDIIDILTHPTDESAPMSVGTLLANHFGMSGGTHTLMSPEQFESEINKSTVYWSNKVMAIIPPSDPQTSTT